MLNVLFVVMVLLINLDHLLLVHLDIENFQNVILLHLYVDQDQDKFQVDLVLNSLGDYLMLDEHLKIVFLLCPSNLEEFSKEKKTTY